MSYFRTCPDCGCNLDPGERCDCVRSYGEREVAVPSPQMTGSRNAAQIMKARQGNRLTMEYMKRAGRRIEA